MAGAILERILTAGTVEDEHGNVLPLRGNISAHQGQRISACIGRYGIERTLEVGFAYGISSLYTLARRDGRASADGCSISSQNVKPVLRRF
jgi:hypothetical protein